LRLNKKNILLISGIIISIICTWLFARKIEWDHLSKALREANYVYVLPAIIIIFASHYVRAIRWSSLITPIKKVSILNLFSATMIGFMASNILPARVGEIIRPIIIGKKENIKMTACIATIVVERIFDILSLIIVTSILLFFMPLDNVHKKDNSIIKNAKEYAEDQGPKDLNENSLANTHTSNKTDETDSSTIRQLRKWSIVLTFVGILAIVSLFLLSTYPEKSSVITEKLIFFLPHNIKDKVINLLHAFISGLQILDNKKQLLWIGILSLIVWMLNAAGVYVLSYSFNIGLSFAGACFVIVCLAIAIALPQAPGFIGVFHIATQKSLDIFGVGLASAQSYAIVLWTINVIPVIIVGLLFLWREGMHLGDLSIRAEKPEQ